MQLSVAGRPLHTRSLTVSCHQREDGRYDVHGAVLDLRKCGFVPVAGMLQTAGIVHHMQLDGVLDPATRVLDALEGSMPTPAFEPGAITRGESCRDPLPRLRALEGKRLDDGFVAELREVFGAHLGCSHLLALGQLTASALLDVLARPDAAPGRAAWRTGERIFHRSVEIDGFELDRGGIQVAAQLVDLHFRPTEAIAAPMQRFGDQAEALVRVDVDVPGGAAIESIQAFERKRAYESLEEAEWRDRSGELDLLVGQSVMAGMSKRLVNHLGGVPAERPFLDALLSVAPGFVQCIGSLSERWHAKAKQKPTLMGVFGRYGSCYMWRHDGALAQVAKGEGSEPPRPAGSRDRST